VAAPVAPTVAGAAAEPVEHSTDSRESAAPQAAETGAAPQGTAAAAGHTALAAAAAVETGWVQVPAAGRQAGPAAPADTDTG
jgi:hypothetical protein